MTANGYETPHDANRLKIATYNTDIFKTNGINNKLIKNLSKKMQIFYANMIKIT